MSITTEIQALNTNLTAAKGAVEAKGGTIGNTGLAGLASEIAGIPSGGSSEPTVPASPDGVYVKVKAYNIALRTESYENIDTSTTVVSFTQVGYDPFGLVGIDDADFMLDSVFRESPITGNPYNLLLRWDYSNHEFELVFYDSTDQENVVFSFQEWDAEAYGIVFSDTSFMFDSANHDLAYILMTQAPNYVELATISINDSTDFATFMTPDQISWDNTEIGMGFGGVMRTQNNELVQKQFATSINFGSLASSLTSIGNGFYYGSHFLQSLYNLPSSVTTIGNNFLYNCLSFNSYFKIPSGATIGTNFLAECTSFNQPLQVPQGVAINDDFLSGCSGFNSPLDISSTTQIGSNFLKNCSSFNQPLTLNSSATIKSGFLEGCTAFNQAITIPSNVTFYNSGSTYHFMFGCNSMLSPIRIEAPATAINASNYVFSTSVITAAAYTTGMTLSGDSTIVQAWKTKFADRSSSPFRKLLVDMDIPQNTLVLNDGTKITLTDSDVIELSGGSWPKTIGGVTVYANQIYGVDISGLSVTFLKDFFLANSNVRKLVLCNTITTIYRGFLYNCPFFNYDLELPDSVEHIGGGYSSGGAGYDLLFMHACNAMVGTIDCQCPPPTVVDTYGDSCLSTTDSGAKLYTTGVKLTGTYATAWKTTFPDHSGPDFYRKLIIA